MSDIEPSKPKNILDEVRDIQEAGILHVKGYSNHEIASLLSINVNKAKEYVGQYKLILEDQADHDPYFLEKLQFNTLKALDEFDQISKEAWETVSIATDHGMVAQRIQALKILDLFFQQRGRRGIVTGNDVAFHRHNQKRGQTKDAERKNQHTDHDFQQADTASIEVQDLFHSTFTPF